MARRAVGRQRGGEDRAGVGVAFGPGQHLWKATTMRGRLITIEGLDGAGKTTLADRLVPALAERGVDVELLREPGGVELSERIRTLVKDPALRVDPRAEALLYAAARAQLVRRARRAAARRRAAGCCSTASSTRRSPTRARAAGSGSSAVRAINDFGTGGLVPDRTLLLARRSPARATRGRRRAARRRTASSARTARSSPRSARRTTSSRRPRGSGSACSTRARRPATVLAQALRALADLLPSRA